MLDAKTVGQSWSREFGYTPVFLEQGWLQERYWGWRILQHDRRIKVLQKRYGAGYRYLLVTRELSDLQIGREISAIGALQPLTITVKDLTDQSDAAARSFGGRLYHFVSPEERMMNTHTFVWHVARTEEELWANLSKTKRNYVGRAERDGLSFTWLRGTQAKRALDAFLPFYAALAKRVHLPPVSAPLLRQMMDDDNMSAAVCSDAAGQPAVVNLIFQATPTAVFLYGARAGNIPVGAGDLIQWRTVLELKRQGYQFYDLGSIPALDERNGLYAFKEALGAQLVAHGREYIWRSPLYDFGKMIVNRVRQRHGERAEGRQPAGA